MDATECFHKMTSELGHTAGDEQAKWFLGMSLFLPHQFVDPAIILGQVSNLVAAAS